MENIKVGDKVKITGMEGTVFHGFELGEIVTVTGKNVASGTYELEGELGLSQLVYPEDFELVKNNDKFEVGDKVRMIMTETSDDYYGILGTMINDNILTVTNIRKSYNYEGETVINVEENGYSYHPSWLEKVEYEIGDKIEVVEIMGCVDEIVGVEVGDIGIIKSLDVENGAIVQLPSIDKYYMTFDQIKKFEYETPSKIDMIDAIIANLNDLKEML